MFKSKDLKKSPSEEKYIFPLKGRSISSTFCTIFSSCYREPVNHHSNKNDMTEHC